MGVVLSINGNCSEGEQSEITITGKARCILCGHEWSAQAPGGTTYLQCPSCRCFKGAFVGPCSRDGIDIWRCGCGNTLFELTKNGAFCPHCGSWVTGWCE
jgi:hypothetical protein